MINFQKLQYFCAMVEEGGIHKAARRLGLSQPPLSMALKELEADIGCQLIFRHGKNWIVTDAGNRLYEEGRAILAKMRGLPGRILQNSEELQGLVRVGFSTSCVSMFQTMMASIAQSYPCISCQTLFSDSESLARHLRQRIVELAVLYLPLDGSEFLIRPLAKQKLVAVFSPLLPTPPASVLSLAEICNYLLMIPRRWNGGGIYALIAHALQQLNLEARIICFSQDSFVLLDLLEKIPAVSIIPQCEAEGKLKYEERYILELSEPLTPAVVTLRNIWLSRPVQRLVEMLQEDFGASENQR